jgi:RNA polymerase sigma-70 factor, ECF subfamily
MNNSDYLPYFRNYERFSMPWKLAMGDVDGEPVVIILRRGADTWTPYLIVRLNVIGQHIDRVVDYQRLHSCRPFNVSRTKA